MRAWLAGLRRDGPPTTDAAASRLGLGLLVLGLACRLYVYLLGFPLWRDEASLALNLVGRDFRGLLCELDNLQVAPLLFLWVEKAVYQFLGGSAELLRLVPMLAGMGGLVLFARLARRHLEPLPAALAVGVLAVAPMPIHLAAMVKPYSLDLFFAALLLNLAADYLRRPERAGRLAALAGVLPLAVTTSYPAVFVAGAVGLVLAPAAWRHGGRAGRGWFVAFNCLCAAAFLAHLRYVGREAYNPEMPSVRPYMAQFWDGALMPRRPLAAVSWLVRCHVGHMLSYPVAFNGGGLLGLFLVALGVRALWQKRQTGLVGLCLLPFALNLLAAVLHRYPYAGDQRLEQHLAPGLCLLLGAGAAEVIRRLASLAAGRTAWTALAAGLLALTALTGAVSDTLRPYHDEEAVWARDIARHLDGELRPQDRLVLPHPVFTLPCLRWQFLPFARQICPADRVDWDGLARSGGRLWLVDQMLDLAPPAGEPPARDLAGLVIGPDRWQAVRRIRFLAREPLPGEALGYRYCCDLHVIERTNRQDAKNVKGRRQEREKKHL